MSSVGANEQIGLPLPELLVMFVECEQQRIFFTLWELIAIPLGSR